MAEGDEQDAPHTGEARARLRAVAGPVGPVEPQPSVRLRREFKGLTVADLLCADLVEQLPGRVRSALRHLERGDLAAAERALPGEFAPVLPGPGHRRRRSWRRRIVVAMLLAIVAAAVALYA
ncbi:MAG: hypothetical protein JNL08_01235 [Planctomycetes bacterium]|nr:hypothetical protein [Planctomycetota bacterium]